MRVQPGRLVATETDTTPATEAVDPMAAPEPPHHAVSPITDHDGALEITEVQ
jgi:hypothetical protein